MNRFWAKFGIEKCPFEPLIPNIKWDEGNAFVSPFDSGNAEKWDIY